MVMKQTIIRAGLETLYFSGAYEMLRPFVAGVGAILTLHHVRPARPEQFQPNRLLEITPEFLDEVLIELRRSSLDLVSLDEMHRRLVERDPDKALALLKSAGPASTISGWSAVAGALAIKDPALAMEVLRSAPVAVGWWRFSLPSERLPSSRSAGGPPRSRS